MNAERDYTQRWFILGFVLIAGFFIYLLQPILTPFLVSMVLAYLGDPVTDRLERLGLSRTLAVTTVFVVVSLLLVVTLLVLIPLITSQIKVVISLLPHWGDWLQNNLVPRLSNYVNLDPELFNLRELSARLGHEWQQAGGILARIGRSFSASSMALAGFLANLFLIPVVSFYLLRDWDRMIDNIRGLLPRNIEPTVVTLARECDDVLGAFLKGQLMVMFMLGIIYGTGLWLLGLQFAILIGLIAGLASIVPYMGFIVGIGVALVTAFFQFDSWWPILGVVVVFGIGQMMEGMVLTPLLVGDRIGLHPVAVIFAIMAGGQLFGFVGILLALPVAAIVMVLLVHLHRNYKESHLYHASRKS